MLHIQDLAANLASVKEFSKIDLVCSDCQIPEHPTDIPKTVVITPLGLWEFLRIPFGLKNMAQAFQQLMDTVLQGLYFTFNYIDDIVVASHSKAQHRTNLRVRWVFQCLQQDGDVINLAKWQFRKHKIDFLGHHITQHRITQLLSKTVAMKEFIRPLIVKGLQYFLGMVNFTHHFIPSGANIMWPLYHTIKGKFNSYSEVLRAKQHLPAQRRP